jgi:hypothetical protein
MPTELGLIQLIFEDVGLQKTAQIKQFKKQDGLKGLDFFYNSSFVDSHERLWFGSGKGLTMLDLTTFNPTKKAPKVQLNRVDINQELIDYKNLTDSSGLEKDLEVKAFLNYPLALKIPYSKNHLTFHFSAIDWSAPHKIQYSYIMTGLEDEWSAPSSETKADYRNLPYGEYVFKICASG